MKEPAGGSVEEDIGLISEEEEDEEVHLDDQGNIVQGQESDQVRIKMVVYINSAYDLRCPFVVASLRCTESTTRT